MRFTVKMDHSHGGMGTTMFQTTNMAYARMYWYLVAGAVGGFLLVQVINYYETQARFVKPCPSSAGDVV